MSCRVIAHLQALGKIPEEPAEPSREALDQAVRQVLQEHDPVHGGLGGAPKFPRSLEFGLMLHYYHLSRDPEVLNKLGFTLEKMARGGIYDQLGGGFHRYAVDNAWVVPHFEKMLYDNALLTPLYLGHYQLTGSLLSRRVATETLDFVLRDLQAPDGGFYAAWDADSEGVEGKYYVWSLKELNEAVGSDQAPLVAAALGVTESGNFEGTNVLPGLSPGNNWRPNSVSAASKRTRPWLRPCRPCTGFGTRVPPHRDDKIVVSWNGLMVAALAQGFQVLGDRRYYEAAARAARFILVDLFREDRLYRSWHGGRLSVPGFCDDYAHLAYALLELYEADFDPAWIEAARRLVEQLDDLFFDPASGVYFYVARDQEAPLVRAKSVFDQTLPSGSSMAARVCLKLHRITEAERYQERALGILQALQAQARQNPWGFAHLLTVQALHLTPPVDLTLVGDPGTAPRPCSRPSTDIFSRSAACS